MKSGFEAQRRNALSTKDHCVSVVIFHFGDQVSREEIEGDFATVMASIVPEDLSEDLLERMLHRLEEYVPDESKGVADVRARVRAAAHRLLEQLAKLHEAETSVDEE